MSILSDIFGHRCTFCGKRSKAIDSIYNKTIFAKKHKNDRKTYYHYHLLCLKKVLKSPETYFKTTVDLAIRIVEKIESDERKKGYAVKNKLLDKLWRVSMDKKRITDAKAAHGRMF